MVKTLWHHKILLSADDDFGYEFDPDTGTIIEDRVKKPRKYKVFLINDDFTTMDFVIEVLMRVFYKTAEESTQLMFEIHEKGQGLCGIYSLEIAETKVAKVVKMAQKNEFPLQCMLEPE